MPPNLPDGEILALGGQGTLIVAASLTDRTVHVVRGGQSTRLFAPDDPASGGGIFISASDGPNAFYAVSANLVFFSAEINVLGNPETRFFRWENGILTKLLKPADVTYDFGRNDSAGNFLAARQIAEGSIEYWITDGVSSNTPITLHSTRSYSNAQGVERTESTNFYVMGITADGSFLISETHDIYEYRYANNLGIGDTHRNTNIYFMGSRNNVLASSTSTSQDFFEEVGDNVSSSSGTEASAAFMNSSGCILMISTELPSQASSIAVHDLTGTIINGTNISTPYRITSGFLTYHPQAIFGGGFPDGSDYKLRVGPSATDHFGGNFLAGFGQAGQVNGINRFHENGVALVDATLADGSIVIALGRTSGSAPTITSVEPPPGTNHQAYSFQFTASGSPSPTFNVTAGDLPPGLTLAANGLLSGTPTDPGDFPITLRAANGFSPDATQEYTLIIRPRLPVIFIHGVAGSVLKSGNHTIWPSIFPQDVADLNLQNGPANTQAVDVIREYDVGGLGAKVQPFYAPFITYMTEQEGYVEFKLDGDRSRLSSTYLTTNNFITKPDFFVFPYDWRKPNADHIATLHIYIQRIRELHDGAKVNLVVHSMGGLVMRRYILEHGADDIDKVVTVGSPILGAPEVAFRILTGNFFDIAPVDSINGRLMKDAIATMPSVHELLPSTLYLQNWGFPIFEEKGYDYNGNGLALEAYDTVQLRAMLDTEAEPFNAARNNLLFHTVPQDDWSGDNGAVDYLQIVGKQAVDKTTVGVTVESTTFFAAVDLFEPYPTLNFTRVVGQGDGTVPILSSRRLPELLAPGTLIREIEGPLSDSIFGTLPAGKSAEHTDLMANTEVLNQITEFLDTPPTTATIPAAAVAPQFRAKEVITEMGPSVSPLKEVLNAPVLDDVNLTSDIPVPEITVEHPLGTDLLDSIASTDFGRIPLGRQQQRTFTIRNIATTDLTGLGRTNLIGLTASLTGTNHADFSVANPDPTSLLPGASTELIVTFSPKAGTIANRTAVLHLTSNDDDENPFDIVLTGTSPGRKRISILGASYLTVQDGQGGENTRLSEIAAQQIPGVDIQYGGDEPWMNMETSSDRELTISQATNTAPLEIEVIDLNNAGNPVSLQRYRFAPGTAAWRMTLRSEQAPDLKLDQNRDGNYAPEEAVNPTHSSVGAAVDLTTPSVAIELSITNGQIVVSLSGNDGERAAPTIRFSLDGGLIQTYSTPLNFVDGVTSRLKVFAEDAMGNTSGLIETTLNPALSIGLNPGGTLALAWPLADGYILEETESLTDGWIKSPALVRRSGIQNDVSLELNRPARKFYRLRSQRLER